MAMAHFRFAHAADLHIDSPFRGLRDQDSRVGARLREATFEAFRNLIELCVSEKVDFLVVAGDVYDGDDRSVRAQLRFRDGLAELAGHGIETFVVHGNHDPLDGWQSAISWPEGVHVFGPVPEWRFVTRDGEQIAAVQGVSFPTREVRENLAVQFAPPPSADLFTIGLLHANVGGNPDHDNYAPCTVDDLRQSGLDYWALGHVHTRQTLRRANPAIVYPGNSQGRHPNETGARGCLIVEVNDGRGVKSEFRALDVVRWETAEVSIDGIQTIDALISAIEQRLDDLGARAEGRDVVCRLTLAGRGPMHHELARDGALQDILDTVRSSAGSSSPWVWVERIAGATRPAMDLTERARSDDFLGSVLSNALSEDEDMAQRVAATLSEVFTGRRHGLPKPSGEQLSRWSEEARWKLVELLEPEA
jgi:DNA repair exonuclease SbcCD nuclease subunit